MANANMSLALLGIPAEGYEQKVMRLLIELGAQFVGAEQGSLLVVDEPKRELVFAMTVGSVMSSSTLIGQRVPLGQGITGLAAQTHEVQIGAPTFKTAQSTEPKSVLAAPMLIGDRLIGVITAVTFNPDKRFTSEDAKLYGRVSAAAGVVVDQARRLAVLNALSQGVAPPVPASEEDRLDLQIVESVQQLMRVGVRKKARLAKVLSDLATLATE